MANQRRRSSGRANNPTAPVPCPNCGGDMWDNSETKTGNAPDYVCKDRDCIDERGFRTGVWARDRDKNAAQGEAAAKGKPEGRRAIIIDSAMEQCLVAAKAIFKEQLGAMDGQQTNIINMATTMFIGRTRDRVGILKVEKEGLATARARAAEAKRIREEQEREERAQQASSGADWGYGPEGPDDDDLPF
jgi:hypothetical protein